MKKFLAAGAAVATAATLAISPTADARPTAPNSIVDVAVEVNESVVPGAFDTLITAVAVCEPGIAEVLSQRGQYTVFAPTDAAFAELGLNPENICAALPDGALADILLYHVATGRRDSSQVLASDTIRMLNGDRVTVDAANLEINESGLVLPFVDVFATNGVIHVIDEVLIPG